MSDVSRGAGWWQASDGKWYPPSSSDQAPAPGWWLASDGNWYPPRESDEPPEPGWWMAADGKWYPPDRTPGSRHHPAGVTPVNPADAARPAAGPAPVAPKPAAPAPAATPAAAAPVAPAPVAPVAPKLAPAAEAPASAAAAPTPAQAPPPGAPAAPAGTPVAPKPAPRGPGIAPVPPTPSTARPLPASPPSVTAPPAAMSPAASPAPASPAPASPAPTAARPLSAPPSSAVTGERRPATTAAATAAPAAATTATATTAAVAPRPAPGAAAAPTPDPTASPIHPPAPGAPKRAADLISEPDDDESDDLRRASSGMSPAEQIRARDEQSRRDASVQAQARRLAATRALSAIAQTDPTPPAPAAAPPPATPPAATTAPAAPPAAPPTPEPVATPVTASPLLEVKPSQMFTDTQHLGERLAIFTDRIELRDRADHVRQTIPSAAITNVVVHKRFTGSTVTIECGSGEPIVAKGLKPDQADEIRSLILKRTRQAGADVVDASDGSAVTSAGTHPDPQLDQVALVGKLADLRDAGVLTDDEYRDKVALVTRLASRESVSASGRS